ncbi:hypothetical protein H101_06195 [Trichophyton interdigitale H6]|nr:hypothetical protein H101_06195 [Trichophyton interdigitale H6]
MRCYPPEPSPSGRFRMVPFTGSARVELLSCLPSTSQSNTPLEDFWQALSMNALARGLQRLGIERLHPNIVSTSGLLSLSTGLPPDTKMAVRGAINDTLVGRFMASADSLDLHLCCWRHASATPWVQVNRTRPRITLNATMCSTYDTQVLEL